MKLALGLLAISLIVFYSCEDSDPNSFPKSYKYTGYDSSWNKIIEGYLWIDSIDSVEVKGGWRFHLVSNC